MYYEPITPYVDYIKTLVYYRETTNDQDKNILMERNKIGAHNVIEKKRQIETRRFADASAGFKINGKSRFADTALTPDVLYGLDFKFSRFERPVRINTKDDEKTKRVFKSPSAKRKRSQRALMLILTLILEPLSFPLACAQKLQG